MPAERVPEAPPHLGPLVDVHHHWLPAAEYYDAERRMRPGEEARRGGEALDIYRDGIRVWPNMRDLLHRADAQVAEMDAVGVRVAVLSAALWIEWLDPESSRRIDDGLGALVRQYPDRLVGLVHVHPLQEGALDELRRGVEELGLRGVAITTHVEPEGIQLDAPELRPFCSE